MDVKQMISVNDKMFQYDTEAKKLLAKKRVLAYILRSAVAPFQDNTIEEIMSCIEGEPFIGEVPVVPGMTNRRTDDIVGLNTESSEVNEGVVRFDILFYVRVHGERTKIIINVEAQKDEPTGYGIINRATYYAARELSSQKERDFSGSNYDDIQQVYTIWICMNQSENSMNHICFQDKAILGNKRWKGRVDLINIVLIGITNDISENTREEFGELHHLIGSLFSNTKTIQQKLEILDTYGFDKKKFSEKEMNVMCNLGEGIYERGIEQGKSEGERNKQIEIARNMKAKGMSLDFIAEMTELSIEEIEQL